MNVLVLHGRLGKDPELRHTPDGKAVCNFSVAVDEGYGQKKTTNWHNVVAWEKKAEAIKEYMVKGSEILLRGRQVNRSYEKDGQTKYVSEVVLEEFDFCGSKSDAPTRTPDAPPQPDGGGDDDLPF